MSVRKICTIQGLAPPIGNLAASPRQAAIYYDSDIREYVARVTDIHGTHTARRDGCDYFTDSLDDAIGTAAEICGGLAVASLEPLTISGLSFLSARNKGNPLAARLLLAALYAELTDTAEPVRIPRGRDMADSAERDNDSRIVAARKILANESASGAAKALAARVLSGDTL